MDYSLSHHRTLPFLPSAVKPKGSCSFPCLTAPNSLPNFTSRRTCGSGSGTSRLGRVRPVVAAARASHCEPGSSLNAPLEPRSSAGRFLISVLQNQRQFFHFAAADELKQLADDRHAAHARMFLSSGSDEACLHRRIAQLKEHDCQAAVEDVMYMLIFYKFSEIRVPLVPRLARCIYNGRLEIWPSKDWELESIHSLEVLEMVREHVSAVIGLRVNSSVTDNWATTQIQRLQLGRVYVASILYGYFLKSASLRHHLEQSVAEDLRLTHKASLQFPEMLPHGLKSLAFGHIGNVQSVSLGHGSSRQDRSCEDLRCYIMGFDPETLQRCAKPKSKEALKLIENHSCALFGDEKRGMLDGDEMILTSFLSLKRLVLEAVAFGSFLWDTEEYVDSVYKLQENSEEVSK